MTTTLWIPSDRPITATERPATERIGRSLLLTRLDLEWAHLRTSRRSLRTARSWLEQYLDHPLGTVLRELTDLEQIRQATQRRDDGERSDDAILLALVELSDSDELAGRIVLQHLLPALIVHARRYRSYKDHSDPMTQIVPAAWLAIRSYDVERRRHHVASSLISDAVFQAFRRPLRVRSATEEVTSPNSFTSISCHDGPATALDEFITMLREAASAGVPAHHLEVLRHLVRVGSSSLVAEQRNVTARTVRNHRDRAVDHVRAALAVAA